MFVGELGGLLDGSALRRRYDRALVRAGLRRLRFHDLRHTFGTRMIAKADILRVQEWMGHADIHTTRRYLHFRPQHDDANLVAEAFAVNEPTVSRTRTVVHEGGGAAGVPDVDVTRAVRAWTNPPRSTSASPSTSRC